MKGGEQGAGNRVVTVLVLCPLPRGARAAGRAEAGAAAAVGLEVELRDVERGLLPRRRLVRLVAGPLPGQADPLAAGGGRAVSNGALGVKTPPARPRCQPALPPFSLLPAAAEPRSAKATARRRRGAEGEPRRRRWSAARSSGAWPSAPGRRRGAPTLPRGCPAWCWPRGSTMGRSRSGRCRQVSGALWHWGCGSNEFRLLSLLFLLPGSILP